MTKRELKPGRRFILVVGFRTSFIRWCQHNEVAKFDRSIKHVTETYQLRGFDPGEIEIVMLRGCERMSEFARELIDEYKTRGALVTYEGLTDDRGLNPV